MNDIKSDYDELYDMITALIDSEKNVASLAKEIDKLYEHLDKCLEIIYEVNHINHDEIDDVMIDYNEALSLAIGAHVKHNKEESDE